MAKKKKYAPKEASGGGMLAILSRADLELSNLKKGRISITSQYYRKHVTDNDFIKYGFKVPALSNADHAGNHLEWHKAFKYFWKQEYNKKGQKTDRIGKYDSAILKFGKGQSPDENSSSDSSDESQECQ
ncbi:MAG: hypothetical protein ACO3MG_11445 [Saprospiraceae bacterium]